MKHLLQVLSVMYENDIVEEEAYFAWFEGASPKIKEKVR
jgi:hypothetical protein